MWETHFQTTDPEFSWCLDFPYYRSPSIMEITRPPPRISGVHRYEIQKWLRYRFANNTVESEHVETLRCSHMIDESPETRLLPTKDICQTVPGVSRSSLRPARKWLRATSTNKSSSKLRTVLHDFQTTGVHLLVDKPHGIERT